MATYCVHSFFTGCEKGITQWSKIFVKVTSQQASQGDPNPSEYYYITFVKTIIVFKKIIKVLKVFEFFVDFFIDANEIYDLCRKNLRKNLHFESVWIGPLCVHSCFTGRWLVRFDDVRKYRPMKEEFQICSNRNLSFYLQMTCRRVIAKKIRSKYNFFSFQIRNR